MSLDETLLSAEIQRAEVPDHFGFVPRAKYDHAVAVAWAWRREVERLRSLLEEK